ncbi:MAG TPA: hypothetical protein VIL36_08230 [Acidimicrobiales bacterium]
MEQPVAGQLAGDEEVALGDPERGADVVAGERYHDVVGVRCRRQAGERRHQELATTGADRTSSGRRALRRVLPPVIRR